MTFFSESRFEIRHLPKTKPARKHFAEVAKKPVLAHSGSKRMARLWHRYESDLPNLPGLIWNQCSQSHANNKRDSLVQNYETQKSKLLHLVSLRPASYFVSPQLYREPHRFCSGLRTADIVSNQRPKLSSPQDLSPLHFHRNRLVGPIC